MQSSAGAPLTAQPSDEPISAANTTLEAESVIDIDDYDSDYESMAGGSETFSLTSSFDQYLEQNGRRYHTYYGPDKNPMPSDKTEIERLDLAHECTLLINNNRLIHAPLENQQIHRVLDLGTGTGIWAIDFAEANRQAEVLGIDISPIQAKWVPSNCRFEIEDFEREWVFSAPFDLIHARTIAQSVNNWPKLLSEAFRFLNPGGWIEVSEYTMGLKCDDGTMPDDWPPAVFWGLVHKALVQVGRKFPDAQGLKELLEMAGFVDVRVRRLKLPTGGWPRNPQLKTAGEMCNALSETGYEAYGLHLLLNVLDMKNEEAVGYIERAKERHKTSDHRKVHAYMPYYSVCGRRP